MADVYTNSISRNKKRNRKHYGGKDLLRILLDALFTLLIPILLFGTIVVIVCQYISPERSGMLSAIAIGAPIIYLIDIIAMFYWIVRWKWYRATIMIATVLLGLFYISRYYKFDFDRDYDTAYVERRYHKIMTYNVHEGVDEGLVPYIEKHNPDILCLQEMSHGNENWERLKANYKSSRKVDDDTNNFILTKHRILRSGVIADLSSNCAVWADLRIKDDTIRVVSLHLQSTSISSEDTQFLENHNYITDKERESKLRSILSRLVENNQKRAIQAEVIADFLKQSPYRLVVCGDFNDVPLSYTYRRLSRKLDDTFSTTAEGFAYTYNTKYKLLRIDNIFVSPSVDVVSYEVDNKVALSDHYPVISRVKFELKR